MTDEQKRRMDDTVKNILAYVNPILLAALAFFLAPVITDVPKIRQDVAVLNVQVQNITAMNSIVIAHEAKIIQLQSHMEELQRDLDRMALESKVRK